MWGDLAYKGARKSGLTQEVPPAWNLLLLAAPPKIANPASNFLLTGPMSSRKSAKLTTMKKKSNEPSKRKAQKEKKKMPQKKVSVCALDSNSFMFETGHPTLAVSVFLPVLKKKTD